MYMQTNAMFESRNFKLDVKIKSQNLFVEDSYVRKKILR